MTTKKWFDLGLLAIAIFVFLAVRSGFILLWELFGFQVAPVIEALPFVWPEIVAAVSVLSVAIAVRQMESVQTFGQEVVIELGKVTWPERRETVMSTGVVLVMLAIASVLLFLTDSIWGTLTKFILEF